MLDWTMTGVDLATAAAYEGFEDLTLDETTVSQPAEPAEPAEAPDQDVPADAPGQGEAPLAATALNGAQVASMLTILEQVSTGALSSEAAVVLILVSFPTVTEQQARRIVSGAGNAPAEPDTEPDTEPEQRNLSDLSEAVQNGLKKKASEFNEQMDKKNAAPWRRTSAKTLAAVFKRGVGAYQTNPGSVRPSVQNADQWAYARVNSYLYVLKNDKFRSGKHDTDLLPAEHPLSSKKKSSCGTCGVVHKQYESIDFSVPEGVKEELRRGLAWHSEGESGDGLQPATVAWARRMANGEDISPDKARKMRAWFARHESDKTGEGFNPGEPGYPSPGRVAWALWGGDPGVSWSEKLVRQMDKTDGQKAAINDSDVLIWRNFVETVQKPVEDEMVEALTGYLQGFGQRVADRLPGIVAPRQKQIDSGIVTKQNDQPWVAELLDYGSEAAEVDKAMRSSYRRAFAESARAAVDSMPADMAEEFTFPQQRIDQDVDDSIGDLITNIESQARADVQDVILEGLEEGRSIGEMQQILQGVQTVATTGEIVYAFGPSRALAIARTESTRAVNAGGIKTWESAAANVGAQVNFRWLSQPDARNTHRQLHDTLREPDGFWYGGGVKGSAPGNFIGSRKLTAAMNINCRCTFVPEVE